MADQSLADFVESVSGGSHLRVEYDFGDGFVRLHTSEAERRQAAQDIRNTESIVLELLRNSFDAHASRMFVAMSREGDKRLLTVIDNGLGIPGSMHDHVFEPRVTSKLNTNHMDAWGMHGRGMALYSIRVNADIARVMQSGPNLGCSIHVETNTKKLSERSDQSSFPTFDLSENGNVNVRGPRNILRTACEFALETRDACSVYVGSPVEVAATIYAYGMSTLSTIDRVFCKDVSELPLVKRLATSPDPDTFASLATEMGLDVSPRSARRIIDGEIRELDSMLDRITIRNLGQQPSSSKTSKRRLRDDARSLKLEKEDAKLLADSVSSAYADIAERYYLEADVEPTVRSGRDRITINIPVVKRP
ncbi:MAG: ATP-binding protein [Eggerthellaceae bacterium]|nr:ATP-binding protein [Eggerthellaceae bacterium]